MAISLTTKLIENVDELEILKMPEGGFLVARPRHRDSMNYCTPFLFAATTVDEALKYIKGRLQPKT